MKGVHGGAGTHAFDALKARYLLVAMIVGWYWQPGIGFLRRLIAGAPWYWHDFLSQYYAFAVELCFLVAVAWVTRFQVSTILGRPVGRGDVKVIATMVVLVYCVGTVILYVTVYPLSLVFPDFADWWVKWMYRPLVYTDDRGHLPVLPNVVSMLTVCVVGPIMEELIFRGYLLHRWARKWGLWRAVMVSTIVFAIMHPSPLSAFVAGLLFALVYLRAQSLWAAMLVHGISNLAIWLYDLHGVLTDGESYYDVGASDIGDWLEMSISLLVTVFLVDRILRRKASLGPLALPAGGTQALRYRFRMSDLGNLWHRARGR